MRQIILLVLLFVVGQWLVKALRRPHARTSSRTGAGGDARDPAAAPGAGSTGNGAARATARPLRLAEPMIRCVECGVHAPKSDSVIAGGQPFCSVEHAQRYTARAAQSKGREGRDAGRDAR